MLTSIEICLLSFSTLIIILIRLLDYNPPPIHNVYERRKGFYWVKVMFMYILMLLRKHVKRFRDSLKTEPERQHFLEALETHQKLSSHKLAIDAVYFNGCNKNRDCIIVGTARRKNKLVDGFMYIKIESSGLGILETPKLPGTSLYHDGDLQYGAEGLKITPLKPMREWNITYKGLMKQHRNRMRTFNVEIDLQWVSSLPFFNFDTDVDALLMAKSVAYEKWNRDYFNILKLSHQTHYEQFGNISGYVSIEGKRYLLTLDTLRDHSFGMCRDWKQFHRYGLHFISTENGDRFMVGVITIPISFTRLAVGYVYNAEDRKLYPVSSCDLQLYQHGENGDPPVDYAFSFVAGKKLYTVQIEVQESTHFYISKDWEVKVVERISTFEVNGLKGWGVAEWVYRNIKGKHVSDNGNRFLLDAEEQETSFY